MLPMNTNPKTKRGRRSHQPPTDTLLQYAAKPDATYARFASDSGVKEATVRRWFKNAGIKLPRPRLFTPERLRELAVTQTVAQIAEAASCSLGAVYSSMNQHGIKPLRRTRKSTTSSKSRLMAVLAQLKHYPEESYAEIAARLFCSREYVSQIHASGVELGILP
jgi:hypothetical protein